MKLKDTDALYEVIKQHEYILSDRCNSTDYGMFTIGIKQVIDESPAIDAVPVVHGHWDRSECSVCHDDLSYYQYEMPNLVYPYCPFCGAKMDEVSE